MSLSSDAPLGVFDSGLGGLTVVRALRDLLPEENIVYLGDTARVPYGTRSPATVIRYARGCAALLTSRDVKTLIVACNTASAVSLDILRAELDIPVLGVVAPGAKAAVNAAALQNPSPKIGVLGTVSTITSGAYPRAVAGLSSRYEVVGQPAPLLVPLVEEGWLDGDLPLLALEKYLSPLIAQGVGVLVLGCTHYPLLKPQIESVAARLAGKSLHVVDSAVSTAQEVETLLETRGLRRAGKPGKLELLVTDAPESFTRSAERFLGESLPDVTVVDITIDASVPR